MKAGTSLIRSVAILSAVEGTVAATSERLAAQRAIRCDSLYSFPPSPTYRQPGTYTSGEPGSVPEIATVCNAMATSGRARLSTPGWTWPGV